MEILLPRFVSIANRSLICNSHPTRLRIAVALTEAKHGHQMWAESYDRELGDLFELEDDVAVVVGAALGSVLRWAAVASAKRLPADKLDTAGLLQRAAVFLFDCSRRNIEEGERLARRALEEDLDLAYGHTLLAFILAHEVFNYWCEQPEEARKQSVTAANRALELESNDSWVLSFAGGALLFTGEPQTAVMLAERALAREPDNPLNRESLGHALIHVGRIEEALAHLEAAIELSPGSSLTPPLHVYRCYAYMQIGRYEEAVEAGRKGTQSMPSTPFSWTVYANALALNDNLGEARTAIAEIRRLSPRLTLEHLDWVYRLAFEPVELGECYLLGLRKAGMQ